MFTLDLELWDIGRRELRTRKLEQIAEYVDARGGEVLDRYIGPSITMLRARMLGSVVQTLLTVEDVADVDLPPEPDVATGEAFELTIADLPEFDDIADDAPVIGIIDSGVNDHPLLEGAIVGAIGVPTQLGTADDWGHGTRVAGVSRSAIYAAKLPLLPGASRTIASAKVAEQRDSGDARAVAQSSAVPSCVGTPIAPTMAPPATDDR